ncbi:MAG: hypothetical protein DRO11_04380 [Methanobacteriota archaeon]|nr:MAG: hypothetical protein DRO11_04380 [Euryarchaeota archaeon]
MYQFLERIEEIITHIKDATRRTELIASEIRRHLMDPSVILDELGEMGVVGGISRIGYPKRFEKKVSGVDGGIVSRSFYNVDLVMTRAVATVFRYADSGKLVETSYYPSALAPPKLDIFFDPIATPDFEVLKSLTRVHEEVALAREVAENNPDLDLLILDGSIVPQYSDKPSKRSTLNKLYEKVIKEHRGLFKACENHGIALAGVVEDSRGARLLTLIKKVFSGELDVPSGLRDVTLLNHVLKYGEMSFVFPFASAPGDYPPLADLGEAWAPKIYSFYAKLAEYDLPTRVDFLSKSKTLDDRDVNDLASSLLFLSSHHRDYGIPSVLVEANSRAELSEQEMERICLTIMDRLGDPNMLKQLRRNRRPLW